MSKVAVVGCKGRMGKIICELLNKTFEVVGIDKEDSLEMAKNCDLVIDFSTAKNSINIYV